MDRFTDILDIDRIYTYRGRPCNVIREDRSSGAAKWEVRYLDGAIPCRQVIGSMPEATESAYKANDLWTDKVLGHNKY